MSSEIDERPEPIPVLLTAVVQWVPGYILRYHLQTDQVSVQHSDGRPVKLLPIGLRMTLYVFVQEVMHWKTHSSATTSGTSPKNPGPTATPAGGSR